MSKIIKFKKAGKWAEHNPALPQFHVKAGEEREVSNELAEKIEDAGLGDVVKKAPAPKASEDDKGKDDKDKADKGKDDKDKADKGKGK